MPKALAYIVAGLIVVYAFVAGMKGGFPDTRVYYEAAHEHYLMTATQKSEGTFLVGWIYPNNVQFIWYWIQLFSWRVDSILWFVIQSISSLYLTHRLIKELRKYAWIILLSLWWPIGWFLSGSNISVTLLACVLNPWVAAMACIVKPYLIVFFLLCFFYCTFGLSQEQLWAIKRFRLGGAEYLMWIAPAVVIVWKALSEWQRKLLAVCVGLAGVWLTISQFIA